MLLLALATLSVKLIWPLLIYWLVFFVACYVVIEIGQDQLYDEVTPYVGWKVAGGTLIFAAMATYYQPAYETFLTTYIHWTALQALVWVLVFIFVFQFHPWHALGLGLVTMVMLLGLATLGVDTMTKSSPAPAPARPRGNQPIRGSLAPSGPTPK